MTSADATIRLPPYAWLDPAGVQLRCRVQPGAASDAIAGIVVRPALSIPQPALKIRLSAPAIDGKANRALTALLARLLDRPKRAITITKGASSRDKIVTVAGSAAEIARRLPTNTA